MNCQTLQEETPRHNWMCVCWTFIAELVRYGGYTCSCLPVVCVCAVPEYYRADNRTLASLRRHSGTARPLLPSIVPSFLPSFLPHIHPPSLSLHSSLYPSHIPFILCFVSFISSLVYSQWTFSPPHLFTDSQSVILWCLSVCLSASTGSSFAEGSVSVASSFHSSSPVMFPVLVAGATLGLLLRSWCCKNVISV